MKKILLAWLIFLTMENLPAQTITLTPFAIGFSEITDIAFAPGDNRMYAVQQRGRIRIVNTNGTIVGTDFLTMGNLVSQSGSERGLLGIAFHPDYVSNGYFYVNYTRSSNGNTRISRFTRDAINPNIADPSSEVVLLDIVQPFSNHNGGCMKFGSDGYLYIGMGDGGSAGDPGNRAQNPLEMLGKMLRIDVDAPTYTVPLSNPYYGHTDTLPEIWAVGLRNPWRFSFDKLTGDLWIGDVGQGNWEEIDFQSQSSMGGENYGWRCYEGNAGYSLSGCQPMSYYDFPVAVYSHGGGNCSVTGGYVYRGAEEGDLYGKYIYVDYCSGTFRVTYPNGLGGWQSNTLNTANNFFTTFGQDHNGELYIGDNSNGIVYRIGTTLCQPTASIWGDNGATSLCSGGSLLLHTPAGPGFTYQWMLNGGAIGGAVSDTHLVALPGSYTVIVTDSGGCSDTADAYVVTASSNPVVGLSASDSVSCTSGTLIQLMGNPAGGIYSGTGVGNDTFYPGVAGAGVHDVVYTYQDTAGCIGYDTLQIILALPPVVSVSGIPATYCLHDSLLTVTGSPAGGVLSGPGLTGMSFDPLTAGVGTHIITYSYTDTNGCSGEDSLAVTIIDCTLGTGNFTGLSSWNIYPNPAQDFLYLQADAMEASEVEIRIFFPDGRLLWSQPWQLIPGKNTWPISLESWNGGVYIIQLQGATRSFVLMK